MVDDKNIILGGGLSNQGHAVPENIDRLYSLFLAIVMLTCVLGAVKYWAMLMGISNGGTLRFDVAPNHWRFMGAVLATLLPLTALGIWFRNAFGLWGWVLITAMQYIMHAVLPDLFGSNDLHLMTSGVIVVVFIAFRFAFYLREREEMKDDEGKI